MTLQQLASRLVQHLKAAGETFQDEEYVLHEIHETLKQAFADGALHGKLVIEQPK